MAWADQSELSFDYGPPLSDVIDLGDEVDEDIVVLPTGEEISISLSVEFLLVVGYLRSRPKVLRIGNSRF